MRHILRSDGRADTVVGSVNHPPGQGRRDGPCSSYSRSVPGLSPRRITGEDPGAAAGYAVCPTEMPIVGRTRPPTGPGPGPFAYLLIVMGADVVWLPALSVATAVIVCVPAGSAPVVHQLSKVQIVAPAQAIVGPNCTPSP